MRRRRAKSAVKVRGPTPEVPLILPCLNAVEAGGMWCVAVKCIDITQNTDCEGIWRIRY